jgi:hypothetical protein
MTRDAGGEILRDHFVCTLPVLVPGALRAERVRALCRARLERDRRRSRRVAAVSRFGRHIVAPALAAGLFALYAADLVSITLRTFGA